MAVTFRFAGVANGDECMEARFAPLAIWFFVFIRRHDDSGDRLRATLPMALLQTRNFRGINRCAIYSTFPDLCPPGCRYTLTTASFLSCRIAQKKTHTTVA